MSENSGALGIAPVVPGRENSQKYYAFMVVFNNFLNQSNPTASAPTPTDSVPTVATPTVATPTVATPTVATPTVATPTVATPTVATPTNRLAYMSALRDFFSKVVIERDEESLGAYDLGPHKKDVWEFQLKLFNEHIFKSDKYFFVKKDGEDSTEDFLKFFEKFEAVLYYGKDGYRDHFLHQFWVFVLGSIIIENDYERLNRLYLEQLGLDYDSNKDKHLLDDAWLIASNLHDYCYPVGEVRDWLDKFFEKFLPVKPEFDNQNSPVRLFDISIERILSDNRYIDDISRLARLHYYHEKKSPTFPAWEHTKNELPLDQTLFNYYINKVHNLRHGNARILYPHALLSALTLLTRFSKPGNNYSDEHKKLLNCVVYPSALAISLHHVIGWKNMTETEDLIEDMTIDQDKDVLTYLLVLCDNLQLWERLDKDGNPNAVEVSNIKDIRPSACAIGENSGVTVELKWNGKFPKKDSKYLDELKTGKLKNDSHSKTILRIEAPTNPGKTSFEFPF